jgi:hypothetical protein
MKAFRPDLRQYLLSIPLVMMAPMSVQAEDKPIGFIKLLHGHATVTHEQLTYAASLGGAVYQDDLLRTYWDGNVGVTFKDNTRISLGPSSRLIVTHFEFTPAESRYGFIVRLIDGTMQFLSGLTAKLSPTSVRIETPTATVGVRGTRLLARAEP